jgi:uncharacterized protein
MEQSPAFERQPSVERPALPPLLNARIPALDVIRGIGVLGALFVSIWVFGGFSNQQQNSLLLTSKGWNYRVYGAMQLVFSGKMLSLVVIALGASMVIFLSKEHEAGKQPALDVYVKRYLWLILFGIFNAVVLLWPMDILFQLGIMAILLLIFFRMKPKGLLIAALLMTAIYSGKYYWDYADDKKTYNKYLAAVALEKKYDKDSIAKAQKGIKAKKDTLTKYQVQEKQAWEGLLAGKKVDIKKDDDNIKNMRSGSYGKVWKHMLPAAQSREADWTYKKGIWDLAALIFLGMLLYKTGFFTGRFSKTQYWLFAVAGIAIGLLLGWWRLHFQQIGLQDYEKYVKYRPLPHMLYYPVEKAVMAVGYISLVMALISTRVFGKLFRPFAAVGKMALTNYLLQTIICTIFFYGYGMGYFARLTQFQLYFFVAEVLLAQMVFSVLWLRRFNYGPAEWLLRRISYGKWLPQAMRKPSAGEPLTVLS